MFKSKEMKKIAIALISVLLASTSLAAQNYKRTELDDHKIFRYDFDITSSELQLTKAQDDGKLSLENVLFCSQRHNAKAAFNAGFFHDGARKVGTPSWLLINKKNTFAKNSSQDGVYVLEGKDIHIDKLIAKLSLVTEKQKRINLASINNATEEGIQVFTTNYWTSTLSDPDTYEIVVKNGKISDINNHGNNKIPEDGFVISVSDNKFTKEISNLKVGDEVSYKLEITASGKKLDLSKVTALMSGSNIIIKNSRIPKNITNKRDASDFRDAPHARTVLCQIDKTKYAVFIADHNPAQNAYDIPMKEMILPLKANGLDRETALKMPAGQLLQMFQKLQARKDTSIGIGLGKLASFLVKEGCINAINLDGGGSATLVVENEVVNSPLGLTNVKVGNKTLRPVGDIFLIKERK